MHMVCAVLCLVVVRYRSVYLYRTVLKIMMTSTNGNIFFALLALCAGNSLVTGEFPLQRLVTRSFDVFFELQVNKRLNQQSWGWWIEMPSRSLWRHGNVNLSCQRHVKIGSVLQTLSLLCPPDPWYLPGTSLLSGFQSSRGALKTT